jgi:hypothetical protein
VSEKKKEWEEGMCVNDFLGCLAVRGRRERVCYAGSLHFFSFVFLFCKVDYLF